MFPFQAFLAQTSPTNAIKFIIFLLQNHIFRKLSSLKTPKLLRFTHFSWGKIWFENFAPCKNIDIMQFCGKIDGKICGKINIKIGEKIGRDIGAKSVEKIGGK